MPTIFWFLRMLAILALIAYAAMAVLVWTVHPRQTDFSEPVAVDLPAPVAAPDTSADPDPARPNPPAAAAQ